MNPWGNARAKGSQSVRGVTPRAAGSLMGVVFDVTVPSEHGGADIVERHVLKDR